MRKTRIKMFVCKSTVPRTAVRLCRCARYAVFGGIPVVKFVHRKQLVFFQQHAVLLRSKRRVTEAHEVADLEAFAGERQPYGIWSPFTSSSV